MSLRVWLPLNGDLTNNGLSDVSVTNNGTTVDNNGKIGKCYAFSGSSTKLTNVFSQPISSSIGSLACWVKFNSFPTTGAWYCLMQLGALGGYAACRLGLYMEYSTGINVSVDGSSTASNVYTHSLSTNTWYHLCATYDGTTVKLYIDGTQVMSKAVTKSSYTTNASNLFVGGTNNFWFKGSMNDVRYYDHALSPKEVKLLSQGLVCHYPLNAVGGKAPNLIESTVKSYNPTQYLAYQLSLSENMKANTKYTIQLWDVDVSHTGKSAADLGVDVYWGGGALRMCYWHGTDYFTDGHADYLTATFYVTASTASHANAVNKWLNIYNSVVDASGTRNMSIGKWKLEVGSIATPWTPNVNDDDYSMAVYEDKIIYDSSGYNYNGIPTELSINNNTSRNTVSTMFNGSNSAIKIPLNDMLGLSETADKRDYTISVWTYKTSIGTKSYQTIIGGPANTFELEARNGSSTTPQYVTWSWGKIKGSYNFNEWTHVCFVHTSEDSKLYVNGVLQGTGTSANIPIGSFYIGAWKNSTTQNFEGSMSDFRLYTTALSPSDIQELYNAPVSITNTGTTLTQGEFVGVAT